MPSSADGLNGHHRRGRWRAKHTATRWDLSRRPNGDNPLRAEATDSRPPRIQSLVIAPVDEATPQILGADPQPRKATSSPAAFTRLVSAAREGDAAALAHLWEVNRRWVAVVLLAHKPSAVELDDLMQEVALTLVSRLDDLRDDGGFRAWLRMVAVNAARAAARRANLRRMARLDGAFDDAAIEGRDEGCAAPQGDPSERGSPEEARRLLQLAMQLDEAYREPLLLKSLQGMTYRQIGALLDLPETTVETRITRARRMLRTLADDGLPTACAKVHRLAVEEPTDEPNSTPRFHQSPVP